MTASTSGTTLDSSPIWMQIRPWFETDMIRSPWLHEVFHVSLRDDRSMTFNMVLGYHDPSGHYTDFPVKMMYLGPRASDANLGMLKCVFPSPPYSVPMASNSSLYSSIKSS